MEVTVTVAVPAVSPGALPALAAWGEGAPPLAIGPSATELRDGAAPGIVLSELV